MFNDCYEVPEVLELGAASTLIKGSSTYNIDCCTCGRRPKGSIFDFEDIEEE